MVGGKEVNVLKRIDRNLEEILCIGLFLLMILLVGGQVFSRFIFKFSLDWSEELARFTFIWFVYMGISLAAKHNRHIRIEIGQKTIAKKSGKFIFYFTDFCWLAFNIFMVFYGAQMVLGLMESIQMSAVTRINMGYVYLIIPIGFTLMSLRVIQNMLTRRSKSAEEIANENKEVFE